MRSTAAQLLLPGAWDGVSQTSITTSVGTGAALHWLPEPQVLVRGCDHRTTTTIDLASGADLMWREEAVLGRAGEPPGSLLVRLRVDRASRPLLHTELALGPAWPDADGPAGTGGARVVGTLLLVGTPASRPLAAAEGSVRAGACRVAEDAVLVTALAGQREPVRQLFDRMVA